MKEPARILVVDDEERIRRLLRMYLVKEGFSVDEAGDGREALRKALRGEHQVVILDLMMPELDGWSVCREIRKHSDVPILLLTARGEEYDRILGLELGADDYVVKPFSPREIVLRVQALLRRTAPATSSPDAQRLELSNLVIDPSGRSVLAEGKLITLTPKEFDLLYLLARRPGQAFSREQLLDLVWGYDFTGGTRTVDTHVKNLREKLSAAGAKVQIATVWGHGYRLETEG